MRAVVADVNPARRGALREELERHGHAVTEAPDAGTVLREAAQGAALVVLGRHVGPDDAVDLCRALRQERQDPEPLIVVVGDEEEVGPVDEVLTAGASDVWILSGARPAASGSGSRSPASTRGCRPRTCGWAASCRSCARRST
jgi:DNA-binding response OmpR family regulator